MTETANLKLTMDAPSEPYSVERVNANAKKIDTFAGETNAALASLRGETFGLGVTIPEAADLDTYTTPGRYCSPTASRTATLANSPTSAYGFSLEIKTVVGGRFVQILIPNTAGVFYMRSYLSAGWSNWFKYSGEEIIPAETASVEEGTA